MTSRSAGKRYAAAIFESVSKKGDAQRTARDLVAVNTLMAGSAELRRVLGAASVPPAKKQAIVSAVLKAAGEVSPDVARVQLLAETADRTARRSGGGLARRCARRKASSRRRS